MSTRPLRALALLLLLLLVPGQALADARDDARRAFRTGMELIEQGAHADGALLLQKAYDLLPHPSVLYNIGLAWADAGEFDKSVEAFEAYLAERPDDTAAVERLIVLLRQQEDETNPTTDTPTGPTLPGSEPTGTTTPAPSASGKMVAAPEIAALLERLEALADRIEGTSEPEVDVLADAPEAELLQAKGGDFYEEQVVSASRTATAPVDAPSAITIITAEDIRLSGVTNIPDILRRVPGMSTLTMGAGNANLAVRGFNQRISNKLLVLVDGRSAYFDFLGGTFFRTLSIDLADIERIEVIRGPGSTLYGANAFGGVVNIITKAAGSSQGGQVTIRGGTGETLQGNVQFSGRKGIVGWRGSVGYEQTDRYALEYGPDRTDVELTTQDASLAVRALRANGGVTIVPAENVSIGVSGGLSYVFDNFFAIGVFRDYWLQGLITDVRTDINIGGLSVRAFWNVFDAEASPTWQPVGGLDLGTDVKSHVVDVEALYSGTAMTGPVRHDLSAGAGYRLKTINWDYLDENHLEQHLNGFVEDRITFVPQVVAVLGFRFDQHPLVGFTPSPRATVLLKPTGGQSLRVSAGTAFRTPTFLESYLDLVVPTNVKGVALQSLGSTELAPENIFSVELGYTFEDSDYISFGVNAYYERVSNLIALGGVQSADRVELQGSQFIAGSSTFENIDGVFHALGGEAEVHAFPLDGLDIRANYSLNLTIDQEKKDSGLTAPDHFDRRHPQHMGMVGVTYRSPFGLDANVDFHVVSNVNVPERAFDATGNVVVDDCEAGAYPLLNARVGFRFLEDKLEVGISGNNLIGFGTGGHREHCLGTVVGPRVLGSATYRF
ncbi:MAG: TonB-dependent receptor [Deltaproteobacteria bacterium]|nr:TonB-dependent receptor [Deltaproteobacteria bacterium]